MPMRKITTKLPRRRDIRASFDDLAAAARMTAPVVVERKRPVSSSKQSMPPKPKRGVLPQREPTKLEIPNLKTSTADVPYRRRR